MPFINRTQANSILFPLIWNVLKFSTFVCSKNMYLGTQKLSCVPVILKKLKHSPPNPKGTKQSSLQRGLCFQTWRVLLIVEQNPLYNSCGCLKLTKQLGEKNLPVCCFPRFSFISLWGICFQSVHHTIQKGRPFWMKDVLS